MSAAVQVAHDLTAFWDSMLDAELQNQHRRGLSKLLTLCGLQPHATKDGMYSNLALVQNQLLG